MSACSKFSDAIPQHFRDADIGRTTAAIASEDFGHFASLPPDLLEHLSVCPDCSNDIIWYLEIRETVDVSAFACIHLAYASSSHAGCIVTLQHGVYLLSTGASTGIVIGFCPWCARELPVAAI
jgi:hypothetical protein